MFVLMKQVYYPRVRNNEHSIMDLLVSYNWGQYSRARHEIIRILKHFGDLDPWVEKTFVMGIALVHSCLDNREVIKCCRALWESEPLNSFEFAIKWVPVDYWCATDLTAMKHVIDNKIKHRIEKNQTWGMQVHKRRWQQYHTIEITVFLAVDIDRKVDLSHPDWIVWVDVLDGETAISLLKPQDIFSIGVS
jgi:tRNA(Ser,Leu) C12 N-acetylase TAN1